ncbi:MAG: periplasmic protein TonB [Acidobacteriota bacterium]|nr:periplasmic protein TonB [Acidobacteriota bacterium]
MFQLSRRITHRSAVVVFATLALCVIAFAANAGAQEAPRDSGSLIKPPTIKPPTARAQSSNAGVATSSRRKRRARRGRRRAATTRAAASRVAGKPREVQGVVVDSADSMPASATEQSPRTMTSTRPRGPISGGVLNGKAISKPQPAYPPIAKAANASGTVVVQVLIDEDGKVTQAHAVSGHPLLRKAAEEAARNARFSPTQLSGQPVKVTGVITYNFIP